MKIIEKEHAQRAPGMCLASRDIEGPFIDTGLYSRYRDPYIYLSVRWVMEAAKDPDVIAAAKELGIGPAVELEELQEQLVTYAKRVSDLEEFVAAHGRFVAAVEALTMEDKQDGFSGDETEDEAVEPEINHGAYVEVGA